jgi:hypothetical protein
MRSFEVSASEPNRSGSRLQPKRRGAASIQRDSACFPGATDIVVTKVNRFGFVGRSVKESVHRIANLIETVPGKREAL